MECVIDHAKLKKRKPRRRRVECPQTPPLLTILGNTPNGVQCLRYADSQSPDARRKAAGATGLELFIALGAERLPVSEARFHRTFTKNLIELQYEHWDDGKVATYYGRWVSRGGETGPWSEPTSMRVAV